MLLYSLYLLIEPLLRLCHVRLFAEIDSHVGSPRVIIILITGLMNNNHVIKTLYHTTGIIHVTLQIEIYYNPNASYCAEVEKRELVNPTLTRLVIIEAYLEGKCLERTAGNTLGRTSTT